jgi:hypothetical protein
MKSLFTPSLTNLSLSYLSICIPPSRNPPFRLLGQFDYLHIKNSSAFRNYDRMTEWQDDRQDDRQRILDEYMIDFSMVYMYLLVQCTVSSCSCSVWVSNIVFSTGYTRNCINRVCRDVMHILCNCAKIKLTVWEWQGLICPLHKHLDLSSLSKFGDASFWCTKSAWQIFR